ncbi:hemerythrin domain-containing protein [Salinimicrobium sediminilitoris]|uniref:hemerythrin domain-containing protein n=1 Tax=Salinimicrobium sediminilitoris TaxID=2876715 RepID=UPI001E43FB23|nr:hemerythrin domain-containing protein [Salinimicrobium sediminilitoris]MCC8358337.1 hemerythrin domain-containing protein [Salinimicrobium sediminilitoris]
MEKKPIKRDKNIQPLSRDHHHTLFLCWKIRKGFSKGVAPNRMKTYSDWFFESHVLPHFKIEEKYLFPVLGEDHDMIKRALAEHRRLERLFRDEKDFVRSLNLIEEELELHVRYEERELFNEIQKQASPEQLEVILEVHKDERFQENTSDEFWK